MILKTLLEHGYEAYIVGGAVRDLLLGLSENDKKIDYDFATIAKPEEVLQVFKESFYENEFGTVMLTASDAREQFGLDPKQFLKKQGKTSNRIIDLTESKKIHESLKIPDSNFDSDINNSNKSKNYQQYNFEITTYRSEDAYSDFRRPDKVSWGQSLEEDLLRRDFTINALAIELDKKFLENFIPEAHAPLVNLEESQFKIIDKHNGLEHLENKILKTVGNPNERFREDALRILRAIRFVVELDLEIDQSVGSALTEHSSLLKNISWERIGTEFMKMIASNSPKLAIELLDEFNLLELILPELLTCKGVEQAGHHTTDVWTHSLDALATCPSKDPIVRLATLLHDIGKPVTQKIQNGNITFYNHEVVGARIAKQIAARLRLSKKNQDRIFILVRYHMFHYQPHNTDASIRRFMRKVGLENIDDILDLREGDRLGSGAKKTSWRLEEMKQRMIEQLNQPLDIRDLAINGHDLMDEFSLRPGPILGEILNHLFELVLDNPELNQKEALLKLATEYLQQKKD